MEVLEQSFALLAPQAETLVARFYEELFNRYPKVKPLFANTSAEDQQQKLLAALKKEGHYQAVAETLLDVMQELAGEAWTKQVATAWSDALNLIAKTMLEAYPTSGTIDHSSESDTDRLCIQCHAVQDISNAQALYAQTKAAMDSHKDIVFDTSQVERMDTATLQMLAALFRNASEKGIKVGWIKPTDTIQQSARLLGLHKHLQLTTPA